MINITTEEFKDFYDFGTKTFTNDNFILLDFAADWCVPCGTIAKILANLEKKYSNVKFYKVDCDDEFELVKLFNIKNLPTLIFLSDDGTYKQISGSIHINRIEEYLSDMIYDNKKVII